MPSLKEIRIRITSVNSTKQITSAMKMVSAAKLRKAQNSIIKLRPYASKFNEILQNLSENENGSLESEFTSEREVNKVLLVVISSNRGLCGAFNSNVNKAIINLINEKYYNQFKNGNVHFLCIGKRVNEFLVRRKFEVIDSHNHIFDNLNYEGSVKITESLIQMYADKKYDRIEIVYNQFKNAVVQYVTNEQFLPVLKKEKPQNVVKINADYIFEPNKQEIMLNLIPKSLKIQMYKAILDSWASEHGARMTAMHKATDNATELLNNLTLTYNKARQTSITKEILEIVSGAEALKG